MTITQVLEALPPRVYLRNGELVIQFSNPADLVSRVVETSNSPALIDPATPETSRQERPGRRGSRSAGNGSSQAAPRVDHHHDGQQQES